tara:strand:- start:6551 stop:6832 length:282 start_codon:yes stop_codon:yes gene_type:complete
MVSAKQYIHLLKIRDLAFMSKEQNKIIKKIQHQIDLLEQQKMRCVEKIDDIFEDSVLEIDDFDLYEDDSAFRLKLKQNHKDLITTFIEYRYDN